MNILLITPFQLTDVGGISVVVQMLQREFSQRGMRASILLPGSSSRVVPAPGTKHGAVYQTCLRLPYIRQAPLRAFISFWLHLPLTLYFLYRFLESRRIDVVSIQYPLPWVFYFALLRPFSRWKLVVTLQGSDVHKLPSYSWVDRRLLRRLFVASDRVLAASRSLLAELQGMLPGLRIRAAIVPNGAPVPAGAHVRGASPDPFIPPCYILTVGHVIPRKGIDVLIRALSWAHDRGHRMDLVVVGDGPERPRLLHLARELGLAERIHFAGNRAHHEVLEFIRGCSFFALASRAEGLPLVMLEAMAYGKAVIATRVDGIPEVLQGGYNGLLVEPEDVPGLGEALVTLHQDPALCHTLASRGQEQVLRAYTWEAVATRYLEIFEELLTKPSACRAPDSGLRTPDSGPLVPDSGHRIPDRLDWLARGVASNWIYLIITAVVSFFTMPFMIHRLGDATYGLWGVIVALTGYMTIFDFGVRSSLNRYISRHHALDEEREVNAVISTGLFIYSGLGLIVLAASVLVAWLFPRYFPISAASPRTVQMAIILTGGGLALTFPAAVFNSVLTGLQRYDLFNVSNLVAFGLRTALIIISLVLGYGLSALALATVVSSLIGLWLSYFFARRLYKKFSFSLGLVSGQTMRRLAHYSFYTFLVIMGVRIITDSDHIVIGKFLGTAAVTIYMVASSLVNYSRSLVIGVSSVLIPQISSHEARRDDSMIRQTLLDGTRYCLLVGLPIMAVFLVAGREFINVWLGADYRASYAVLACLSVAWAFSFAESAGSATLFGTSRHRIQGVLVMAEAAVNLALSLWLVRVWGILGVAVGTLIPMAIKNVSVQIYACRTFHIRFGDYLRQSILPPILVALPLALLMGLTVRLFPPRSILEFAVELGGALALTAALFPWLGLSKKKDEGGRMKDEKRNAPRGLSLRRYTSRFIFRLFFLFILRL